MGQWWLPRRRHRRGAEAATAAAAATGTLNVALKPYVMWVRRGQAGACAGAGPSLLTLVLLQKLSYVLEVLVLTRMMGLWWGKERMRGVLKRARKEFYGPRTI